MDENVRFFLVWLLFLIIKLYWLFFSIDDFSRFQKLEHFKEFWSSVQINSDITYFLLELPFVTHVACKNNKVLPILVIEEVMIETNRIRVFWGAKRGPSFSTSVTTLAWMEKLLENPRSKRRKQLNGWQTFPYDFKKLLFTSVVIYCKNIELCNALKALKLWSF